MQFFKTPSSGQNCQEFNQKLNITYCSDDSFHLFVQHWERFALFLFVHCFGCCSVCCVPWILVQLSLHIQVYLILIQRLRVCNVQVPVFFWSLGCRLRDDHCCLGHHLWMMVLDDFLCFFDLIWIQLGKMKNISQIDNMNWFKTI